MPSEHGIAVRRARAIERIETARQRLHQEDMPDISLKFKSHADVKVKEMLLFERLADWMDALADKASVSTHVPVEYLTIDGLRWLAEQQGISSDGLLKSELIEALS